MYFAYCIIHMYNVCTMYNHDCVQSSMYNHDTNAVVLMFSKCWFMHAFVNNIIIQSFHT